ncbi:Voltage-gated Ion Channel (VIC) Superfamily, partial [Thraustotheca clavata]
MNAANNIKRLRNNLSQPTLTQQSSTKVKPKTIAPPRIRQLAVKKPPPALQHYETGYSKQQLIENGATTLRMKVSQSNENIHQSSIRRSINLIKAKAQSPKTYVIDPKSTRAILWDVFMAVLIAYSGITVPLSVCFPGLQGPGAWANVDNVVDGFFGIDIIRNFMIGYHDDQDQLVVNHKAIAKQYFRTWFLLDFVSTFPLQAVATEIDPMLSSKSQSLSSIQLIRVLRVTRILKLTRLAKLRIFFKKAIRQYVYHHNFHFAEDRFGLNPGVVRLVRLVMLVLFLSHVMACFFHIIGQPIDPTATSRRLSSSSTPVYDPNTTWLVDNDLRTESDGIRYMYSLYWVMTTLAGVGYGDVHAVSMSERIYAIFGMMIGASAFGFVIGSISSLLESLDTRAAAYQLKMMEIKNYIRTHKLPKDLRIKLFRYFAHYLQRASLFNESSILSEISLNLRNEVVHETCRDIFKIPAFVSINSQFVMDMAISIKPLFLLADSDIAKERTVGREMYFLNTGIVSVSNYNVHGRQVLLEVLTENTYFGEAPLLFYCLRENTFTSLTNCEMYTLLKEDFDQLLEDYPEAEDILTKYYDIRKKNYDEIHSVMMQRYVIYNSTKDDMNAKRMEDLWPHLRISLNGVPTSVEQFPISVLKLIKPYMEPRVSIFNSAFSKKVILDGIKPKYEKAYSHTTRLQAVIEPTRPWKLRWDVWLGLLIVYNVMSIPFQFVFLGGYLGDTTTDYRVVIWDYCVDSCFGLDIILTFRTGYLDDEGHLVLDLPSIAKRYLKMWFWIDLISTFPVGLVMDTITPMVA